METEREGPRAHLRARRGRAARSGDGVALGRCDGARGVRAGRWNFARRGRLHFRGLVRLAQPAAGNDVVVSGMRGKGWWPMRQALTVVLLASFAGSLAWEAEQTTRSVSLSVYTKKAEAVSDLKPEELV